MRDHILRKNAVRDLTGLSFSQIDRLEHEGVFPTRRRISARVVGWSHNEVESWVFERLHGADAGADL
jgi:predicted DNA-binding transcriptional regulator AlpA